MGSGFKQVVEDHWARTYNFCLRMCLDPARAQEVVKEVFLRAFLGEETAPKEERKLELWLLKIAHHVLAQKLGRAPEVTFDLLDETLRSDATRTDVVRSLTEPDRDFLLWELKQGCMTSVINCLSAGERSAFVLHTIVGVSDEEAAATLDVTPSAFKVRLSRAKKKVADYLAPRCEHVDPLNPCRCPARLGVAVQKGFIRPQGEVSLRKVIPFGRYGAGTLQDDAPLRDIVAIYGNLPPPEAPQELYDYLMEHLESGAWQQLREQGES